MKIMKRFIAVALCTAVVFTSFQQKPVGATEVEPVTEVLPIDAEHFPDDNFRACVAVNSDTDGDGWLDNYEIKYTWNLYCENSGVESIQGVEYFTELQGLWCKGNKIKEMDLSKNTKLFGVWCSFNPLTELDFSHCPNLAWVYCFNCKLKKLDFKDNPKLAYLECNANPDLKELDMSNNPELENLFCSHCSLKEIDVSKNPLLCELTCFYNNLETLDVSNNPLLKRLDVWHNPKLKDIDISNNKELQYVNIAWTAAKNVNVRNQKHLLELVCGYNKGITSLDLSKNPELAFLTVECDTKLQSLDLSHNPKLYYLMAFGLSSIKSLDISKNYRLCKAYNEGVYADEPQIGEVYSMTLDYGGSSDPFDELRHCIALDNRIKGKKVNAKFNGKNVPDCRLDKKDGLKNSEKFITRGQAMQTLYMLAGEPDVSKLKTRFKDVPSDASYYDAVKWGEANNICFGYPVICDDVFNGEELINRQDFALMAHRFADVFKLGTALDYGRSDWFKDSLDMDFYAWAPFTWAIQWKIVDIKKNAKYCRPHGRITYSQLKSGLEHLMDIDVGATYAQRVGGNYGADGDPNATEEQGTGYVGNVPKDKVKIVIPDTFAGTTKDAYGNKYVSLEKKEKQIKSIKDERDVAGSTFSILQAKQKKVTKNSIKIAWKKVKGAESYVVYGNKCGKKNKYVKLKTVKKTSFTQKKLKKGTYYKYIVVAVGNGKARAVSKTLHIATKGGKVGNHKAVKVNKRKITLKKGKTAKIKAKVVAGNKKLKVKKHRKLAYETSNPKVAKVTKDGKIKAVKKSSCVVYVYAQNGMYKAVKVKVK